MVFGLLASAVTSLAAFAFPTFASYKAIKANDNSQLVPWLMFWSVQACVLFLEHWTYFILQWVPLYKECKMIFTLWMVLPQTQGATQLYLHYLHPMIYEHERDLDRLIVHLHDQVKNKGGQYVEMAVAWIYQMLLGHQPSDNTEEADKSSERDASNAAPAAPTTEGYVASLFSRFRTLPAGTFPDTLSSSLLSFLGTNGKNPGDIIPANLSHEERARYVSQQRAKLQECLRMLDAAAQSYSQASTPGSGASRRPTSRSASGAQNRPSSGLATPTDSDYEDLGQEDSLRSAKPSPRTSGSWFWKSKAE